MIIIANQDKLNKIIDISKDEDYLIIITRQIEMDLEFRLISPEVTAHVYGLVSLTDDSKARLNIKSTHLVENANSRVHVKSVLANSSEFNFEGMIYIEKKAQLSDAYLQNDNLVIGDNAIVNSAPQLEISADDVKASHGVTITTFGDEELYYLNSRGIDRTSAEKLITHGFLSQILKGVKMTDIREYNIPGILYEEI